MLSVDVHSAASTPPICLTGFSRVDPTLVAPPNYSSNGFPPIKVATLPARLPCPLLVHTRKSSSVRPPSPPAMLQLYTHDIRQRPATVAATFIPETLPHVRERGPIPLASVSQPRVDDVPIKPLSSFSMSQPSIDDIRLSVVPPPPHPSAIVRWEATPCCHVATPTDQHPFRRVATPKDQHPFRRVATLIDERLRRVATLTDERLLRCVTIPTGECPLRRVATLTEHLCQVTICMDESGLHPTQAPESATPPAPMSTYPPAMRSNISPLCNYIHAWMSLSVEWQHPAVVSLCVSTCVSFFLQYQFSISMDRVSL